MRLVTHMFVLCFAVLSTPRSRVTWYWKQNTLCTLFRLHYHCQFNSRIGLIEIKAHSTYWRNWIFVRHNLPIAQLTPQTAGTDHKGLFEHDGMKVLQVSPKGNIFGTNDKVSRCRSGLLSLSDKTSQATPSVQGRYHGEGARSSTSTTEDITHTRKRSSRIRVCIGVQGIERPTFLHIATCAESMAIPGIELTDHVQSSLVSLLSLHICNSVLAVLAGTSMRYMRRLVFNVTTFSFEITSPRILLYTSILLDCTAHMRLLSHVCWTQSFLGLKWFQNNIWWGNILVKRDQSSFIQLPAHSVWGKICLWVWMFAATSVFSNLYT